MAEDSELERGFNDAIERYSQFYAVITSSFDVLSLRSVSYCEQVFKLASKIIVKIQKFRNQKRFTRLPEWFNCISTSIKEKNPYISLIAIESMIEILISEKIDPVYEQLKTLIIEESRAKFSKS